MYFITENNYFVIITEVPNPYASDYNQKINIIAKSIYRSRGPFCHNLFLTVTL